MSNPYEKQQTGEPVFTPELKLKLSTSFMKFLNEEKVSQVEREKFSREVIGVPESYQEAERGLTIFKRTLSSLINSPDFPNGKTQMTLKIFLHNLDTHQLSSSIRKLNDGTISAHELSVLRDPINNPISGLGSYSQAVDAVLSTLKEVLTPEVNLAINAYSKKIFLKPFGYAVNKEK